MTSLAEKFYSKIVFRKSGRIWRYGLIALFLLSIGTWSIWHFIERRTDLDIVIKDRPINVSTDRIAIKGYDTVAYFKDRTAKRGMREFMHKWNGASWLFANSEHKDLFASDPLRYAPQYGGFCAQGVSLGKAWDSNPEAWKIIDNKLYLGWGKKGIQNFNKSVVMREKAENSWSIASGQK